jgi:hypothetical protein
VGRKVERLQAGDSPEGAISMPGFSVEQIRTFRPVLSFLNEKDRDILHLIFVAAKKQKEVQRILRRSQPSLCYDIKRIRRRLKFVFYLHSVFDIFVDFLRRVKEDKSFEPEELDVLTLMFYTTSFTLASRVLGMPQVRVRYLYDRCLRRMEAKEMWDAYEIFMVVRSNLNIVRRMYSYEEPCIDLRHVFIPY